MALGLQKLFVHVHFARSGESFALELRAQSTGAAQDL